MNDGGSSLISLKNIHQTFEVGEEKIDVLKDVSFEITPQTFNIIYGQSGSGKSTLLNILTGLQQPTKGKAMFNGMDVYTMPSDQLAYFRANQIGIVYQQNYWIKSLNVTENVAIPLYLQGYTRRQAEPLALQALERTKMRSYAKKHPSLLSGGEQQRIAMARAIVNDPMVIIADEPTGNLDSTNGDMIMDLLVNYQSELGRTIILVTHNLEYLTLADHLLNIKDGTMKDLQDEDTHETTEELMKDIQTRIAHFAQRKNKKQVKNG